MRKFKRTFSLRTFFVAVAIFAVLVTAVYSYRGKSEREISFYYLYTRRGDLTGYGAFQDHLVVVVSDGVIVDLILESVFDY